MPSPIVKRSSRQAAGLVRDDPSSATPAAPVRGVGRSYALATFLLLLPSLSAAIAALGFAAGIGVTPLHLPLALLGAALATWAVGEAEGLRRREVALALGMGIAAVAVAASAAHLSWDLSYDGQAYHQSAIRQLAAGWNPLRHTLTPGETTHGLWLNHYVRAVELGAAAMAALTGSLESGKALGITLALPAAIFCALALRRAGLRRGPAVVGAAVVVANPIVLSQLATFYVDGALALVFVSALALAWISWRGQARTAPPLLAAALALLANVKFTATVYAALLLAGYALAALLRGREGRWRRIGMPVVLTAALTLAIGWQPLVTNAAEHGHPFHPVAGPSRVDGLSGQTPYFRHRDPVRRLLESTFSESSSARVVPAPKLPFVVRRSELAAMAVPDVRVGGFGPLFALAVVLAALGVAALPWSGAGAGTRAGLLVAAGVLATALINPGAWWARFVPQLWIAAALASVALATSRRASGILGVAAVLALAVDATLVGASTVSHQVETQSAARAQARDLARRSSEIELPRGEMEALDLRLSRDGLRARYVASCAPALPLVGTYALYCEAGPTARAPEGAPAGDPRLTRAPPGAAPPGAPGPTR